MAAALVLSEFETVLHAGRLGLKDACVLGSPAGVPPPERTHQSK